ncbi:hypothetical protein BC831DRAFT_459799 [Entophlyctis helioformis]|nr:hypothetical protein BC831DRAFT_459799 [Entophlyctis helioformis]
MQVVLDGGFELLVDAVSMEAAADVAGSPESSLRLLLLRTIANIAALPDAAAACSKCFLRGNGGGLDLFLGSLASPDAPNNASRPHSADSVAVVIANAAKGLQDGEPILSAQRASLLLRVLAARCATQYPVHAVSTQEIALALFKLAEFVHVFRHVADQDERFASLVSALLSHAVQSAFHKTIESWLNASDSSTRSCGLLGIARSGVLDTIMDVIELEYEHVQLNTLRMLVSACNEPETAKLVAMRCAPFLFKHYRQPRNAAFQSTASLALVKLMMTERSILDELMRGEGGSQLAVDFFIKTLQASASTSRDKAVAVEALTYLSVQVVVKEKIAAAPEVVRAMHAMCVAANEDRGTLYGVAALLSNVTAYRKRLSAEEEQVRKLKAFANNPNKQAGQAAGAATGAATGAASSDDLDEYDHPLNQDEAVAKRVRRLVASAGLLQTAGLLAKSDSLAVRDAVSRVYLSVATDTDLRGALVQQGGCRALLSLATHGSDEGMLTAAHALAKTAITTDPNLAFKGQSVFEAVRPLIALCRGKLLLRQFEALMALTNLASMNDDVRALVVREGGLPVMEELQFSDHAMVRRAATEAICNMVYHPAVFEQYARPGASSRLKMMVALSDAEDFATRRAASGVLAVLSSDAAAAKAIGEQPRAAEIVVGLVADQSVELQHRGAETVKNMALADRGLLGRLIGAGAVQALARLVDEGDETVVQTAIDALQAMAAKST